MKKLTALILVLALTLGCVSALAETWYCTECGQANSGNFCGNCGAKKPAKSGGGSSNSGGLTITDVSMDSEGSIKISWNGGSAPYNVMYQAYVNSNYNQGADTILWNGARNTYNKSVTLKYDMVPGEHYWVIVTDSQNHEAWYDYNPRIQAFTAVSGMSFGFFSLRQKVRNKSQTVTYFSANEIKNGYLDNIYGATIKISLNRQRDYTFFTRFAVIFPNGEPYLFVADYVDYLKRYGSWAAWESFDFKNVWSTLMSEKGEIPAGTYTFKIFFDNTILGQQTFTVR